MHPALLQAYDEAMPALQAQEQLAAVAVAQLGAGTMRPEAARQLLTSLRRQAGLRRPARRVRATDLARLAQASGAHGLGLAVVRPERPQGAPGAPGGSPGTPGGAEGAPGPVSAASEGG